MFSFFKAAALTACIVLSPMAHAQPLDPLITAGDLNARLADDSLPAATILDIRGPDYDRGHIAGAVSAPYGLFRGPADNPGQMLPVDQLQKVYETLGLEPDQPVVIVAQGTSDSDFGAAARVYWTLKSSGFTDLSILNGGAMAWVNNGLPVSTDPVSPAPSSLKISWNDTWTADTAQVAQVVAGTSKAVLLDARPAAFFEGEMAHGAAERPGTLPGAINLPHTEFFTPGATAIRADADVTALKARLGITENEPVLSFCNTGHWAATDWFALSEIAGIEGVKLYPGSMVEYSKSGHEMANTPGLIANLLRQIGGGN